MQIEYYNSYGLSKIVNITILLAWDTLLTPEISKYGHRPFYMLNVAHVNNYVK